MPRIDGKYSSIGTLGVVEQTGRLPSGEPAAVIRGQSRVRIGTGTVGPGAALWVEGTVVDEPPATARAQELAREYRGIATSILQKRGAWQVIDMLQNLTDPSALADNAGYASYLSLGAADRAAGDHRPGAAPASSSPGWARDALAALDVAETIQNDVREGIERRSSSVSSCSATTRRHPQGAGRA